MIPQGGVAPGIEVQLARQQPSKTYRMDMNAKRISGTVDGLEAVKQAVYKILRTERFRYYMYDASYGSELANLPGGNSALVQSELNRRIRQALLQDDRITEVQDMRIDVTGDEVAAEFTVVSTFGHFQGEVTQHV
jgi:phage baseplate assembly protein W